MRRVFPLLLIVLAAGGLPGRRAHGDAIVTTRAMKASTIAEVFVEDDGVRIELEVGMRDVAVVADLLADEVYAKLGRPPAPLEERQKRFFAEGLVVRTDDGAPLPGEVVSIAARRRVPRDEITGMPAPVETTGAEGEDADGELVLFITLRYPWTTRPDVVSIRPPRDPKTGALQAEVGFVAYHRGVAVNDFRYLGQEEVLDLDWEDAWFSRFRNRNLWRRYDAPLSAFLYVDPFEVRLEMVLRPRDLQQWVDLGLEGKDVIAVADQPEMKQRVLEFLEGRCPLSVDGQPVTPTLERIAFVRRGLRQTGVVDPPEDLPVASAMLGVIYVHPIEGLPQTAAVRWTLFAPKFPRVPGVATDEAGGLPALLTVEDPVLTWRNFLKKPTIPTLRSIPAPQRATWPVPLASILCLLLAAFGAWRLLVVARPRRKHAAWALVPLLVAGILLWPRFRVEIPSPFGGPAAPDGRAATELVGGLLANVYHAFDYRGEEKIYDTLAHSTAGDVLEQVYLDTQRALALQNQGGARVKIQTVDVERAVPDDREPDGSITCACTWTAMGSVGHWGHIHQRSNRYEANIRISPMDGTWKITAIEVLDEERL